MSFLFSITIIIQLEEGKKKSFRIEVITAIFCRRKKIRRQDRHKVSMLQFAIFRSISGRRFIANSFNQFQTQWTAEVEAALFIST